MSWRARYERGLATEEARRRDPATDPSSRPSSPIWWAFGIAASVVVGPLGALRAYGSDDPSIVLIAALSAAAILVGHVVLGAIWTVARRR